MNGDQFTATSSAEDNFSPPSSPEQQPAARAPFDVDLANEACSLLIGEKDFGGFTSLKKNYSPSSIRNIFEMNISPAQPLMNSCHDSNYNGLKFYSMTVTANAFCYRQVRRMMSVVLAIGTGHFTLDYLKMLLLDPRTPHFHHRLKAVPEYGLYLINVDYPPEAFIFEEDIYGPSVDIKDCSNSKLKELIENR